MKKTNTGKRFPLRTVFGAIAACGLLGACSTISPHKQADPRQPAVSVDIYDMDIDRPRSELNEPRIDVLYYWGELRHNGTDMNIRFSESVPLQRDESCIDVAEEMRHEMANDNRYTIRSMAYRCVGGRSDAYIDDGECSQEAPCRSTMGKSLSGAKKRSSSDRLIGKPVL